MKGVGTFAHAWGGELEAGGLCKGRNTTHMYNAGTAQSHSAIAFIDPKHDLLVSWLTKPVIMIMHMHAGRHQIRCVSSHPRRKKHVPPKAKEN